MTALLQLMTVVMTLRFAPHQGTKCVRPTLSAAQWPLVRSPRLPGVELRLPPTLTRNVSEDTSTLIPRPRGSLWSDMMRTQVSVWRTDSTPAPLFAQLPSARVGRAEYSRCDAIVDGGHLIVVAYNKREEVGDMAYVGPFQVFAEYRASAGTLIQFEGSSESRTGFEQLRAAAYTIRMRPPPRRLPNDALHLSGGHSIASLRSALVGSARK